MPAHRKNTNKTAHVLNVITAGQDSGVPPFAGGAHAAAPPIPSAPSPVSPPAAVLSNVVEVEHAPEELSDQIRKALSEELARGKDNSFSVFQPETVQISAAVPAPQPSTTVSPAVAAQPTSPACEIAPRPVSLPQAAAPQSGSPVQAGESDESEYINVMQVLVDEKTPRYMQLLGVCPCSRCLADVKALALCHLEPKYIVIQKSQRFPYSVYENYYNAAVTSQIISACRVVMGNPRH
ncbi:hypothetical protein OBV_05890 [Oscillibacter valericigenes Sjm18-20]|nr:hypothetical protein OBV_05890 [Oscillibacter valericigenes Sjm18-20]